MYVCTNACIRHHWFFCVRRLFRFSFRHSAAAPWTAFGGSRNIDMTSRVLRSENKFGEYPRSYVRRKARKKKASLTGKYRSSWSLVLKITRTIIILCRLAIVGYFISYWLCLLIYQSPSISFSKPKYFQNLAENIAVKANITLSFIKSLKFHWIFYTWRRKKFLLVSPLSMSKTPFSEIYK